MDRSMTRTAIVPQSQPLKQSSKPRVRGPVALRRDSSHAEDAMAYDSHYGRGPESGNQSERGAYGREGWGREYGREGWERDYARGGGAGRAGGSGPDYTREEWE